ncbi:NUDIX hydrolase [Pantoea septica]|uniref:NUDIX hydrolase n=1 Tax=Pantoea septica TaxID=472695 RepID=UPI0023F083CE|nr:NUDIX domain-containing protein [Pantoea septica]
MRKRPASRLIVLSPENRILLFHFHHQNDALAGQSYWATPGGGLKKEESFEEAASRELYEETGFICKTLGPQLAKRSFTMMLPGGEAVLADERFFTVRVKSQEINVTGWSHNEQRVIRRHHWWTTEEIERSEETIFPRDLIIDLVKSKQSRQ